VGRGVAGGGGGAAAPHGSKGQYDDTSNEKVIALNNLLINETKTGNSINNCNFYVNTAHFVLFVIHTNIGLPHCICSHQTTSIFY
jgi:hypothetical protein